MAQRQRLSGHNRKTLWLPSHQPHRCRGNDDRDRPNHQQPRTNKRKGKPDINLLLIKRVNLALAGAGERGGPHAPRGRPRTLARDPEGCSPHSCSSHLPGSPPPSRLPRPLQTRPRPGRSQAGVGVTWPRRRHPLQTPPARGASSAKARLPFTLSWNKPAVRRRTPWWCGGSAARPGPSGPLRGEAHPDRVAGVRSAPPPPHPLDPGTQQPRAGLGPPHLSYGLRAGKGAWTRG